MSNRLDSTIHLPFFADPALARTASYNFIRARARIERAIALGGSVASLFTGIADIINDIDRAVSRARAAQRLCSLTERDLAARGLERGGIPAAVWDLAPPPASTN